MLPVFPPLAGTVVPAQNPGDRMTTPERTRIRQAAIRAPRVFPGAVGELVAGELFMWELFGYRLGGGGLVMRLVEQIETAEA